MLKKIYLVKLSKALNCKVEDLLEYVNGDSNKIIKKMLARCK